MTTITVTLPKKDKNRLAKIASRFGLSLPELSRHILESLSETVPMESLTEYERPISLKQSLRRGYRDARSGRLHAAV